MNEPRVALLRGINVGGRNKVPMAELRELFESLGHTTVARYIHEANPFETGAHDPTPHDPTPHDPTPVHFDFIDRPDGRLTRRFQRSGTFEFMSDYMEGQAAAQPAGWYPATDGTQRYWDGAQWTEHVAPAAGMEASPAGGPGVPGSVAAGSSDDNTMGMLAHLLAIVSGFLGPLIIWLMKKDTSPYVDYHGKEALNFQITMFFAWMASFVLAFVLIGFLLMPILLIVGIVLPIMGGLAANKGEYYKYPLTLRLIM